MKTAALVVGVMMMAAAAVPSEPSLSADLACETARMLVYQQATPIKPTSDSCENCSGLGRLGDGRVSTICPICKGTGKKPKAACANGRCPL
jgi:hypothetical protein